MELLSKIINFLFSLFLRKQYLICKANKQILFLNPIEHMQNQQTQQQLKNILANLMPQRQKRKKCKFSNLIFSQRMQIPLSKQQNIITINIDNSQQNYNPEPSLKQINNCTQLAKIQDKKPEKGNIAESDHQQIQLNLPKTTRKHKTKSSFLGIQRVTLIKVEEKIQTQKIKQANGQEDQRQIVQKQREDSQKNQNEQCKIQQKTQKQNLNYRTDQKKKSAKNKQIQSDQSQYQQKNHRTRRKNRQKLKSQKKQRTIISEKKKKSDKKVQSIKLNKGINKKTKDKQKANAQKKYFYSKDFTQTLYLTIQNHFK